MKETEVEQKFLEVMKSNGNDIYTLELTGCDVSILHGLVTLAMDHPNMQKMSQASQQARRFRDWCEGVWVKMGFSEKEANLLDRLREELSDYPQVLAGHIVEQRNVLTPFPAMEEPSTQSQVAPKA